jgi:hypothetical protein
MEELEIKLTHDECLQVKRGQTIMWISYEKGIKIKITKEDKQ